MNIVPDIDVRTAASDDIWYKEAILYQLHVKAFADSNNDGIGDFPGLTSRLDYLQELGVTALWLLPFYPSPGRDDGYDIADYEQINSAFGTLDDFQKFMTEAKVRGLRVITELVINHTSDQHPWFQRARTSPPGSDERDWYVWSDTAQKYAGTRIIFSDTEKSNWAWDDTAQAFYWHRFFSHQPDLNYANPNVLNAMLRVMRKWLDMGVDGFRLDAIPYLCEREGTSSENLLETHAIIKKIRREIDLFGGRLLLAEANQWPEDVSAYFGDGDECHMAYHFPLMPRIYMAIAQEDRFPIADIIRQTPEIPPDCQWALFLRNHDELTLEMVTDAERDYLWSAYAADPRARFNLGIRRRLAPLMDNDRRKIELMNSLLMSLPGTPIIYYGDEIGMGDNIYLGDRNGVRTPMQWTSERNGGFSKCDPARLYLPVIMDPVYGHQAVNVEAQAHSVSSLLSWTKRLSAVRKSTRVFGRGTLSFVRPANRAVLAYLRQYEGETILCIANLSRSAQAAELDLSAWKGRQPQELLGRTRFPRIGSVPYVLTLAPYGFFWFQLVEAPEAQAETRMPEFVTLVMNDGWKSLGTGRTRVLLEQDVLPAFLPRRRWFAEKEQPQVTAALGTVVPLADGSREFLLALVDTNAEKNPGRYFLPLGLQWTRFDRLGPDLSNVLAAVRHGPREGALLDVAGQPDFITRLLLKLHAEATVTDAEKRVEFRPAGRFTEMPPPSPEGTRVIEGEQSNTSVIVDENFVVKIFRRVSPGTHPEIEVGRVLAEAQFQNCPPFLGSVELVEGDERTALAVVHGFVENQGDAWAVTNGFLDRFLDEQRVMAPEAAAESPELASYLQRMQQIGRRTAELHIALSSREDLPDFAPEIISGQDIAQWTERLQTNFASMLDQLAAAHSALAQPDQELIDDLMDRRPRVLRHIGKILPERIGVGKFRGHGDLHLGQILVVKDDVVILDFEGEPKRSLTGRRSKSPAARDVAGVIRSIDYGATGALERADHIAPDERSQLAPKLDYWRECAAAAFLGAYKEHTSARLWPNEPKSARRLLEFFLLEKAVYEVGYELSNRPAWLHVPLEGLRRILRSRGASS